MRTLATDVTERGQVSVPAGIRKRKRLAAAVAMLGHASTFRAARRTKDWMRELRAGSLVLALALAAVPGVSRAEAQATNEQALAFGVYWPPLDSTATNGVARRPLLTGAVTARTRQEGAGVDVRLEVTLTRPSDEASRKFWNNRLAYAEFDWMARLRVWDSGSLWLWPNLPYLLRIHGVERDERYGGVDPGKGVDNDFAAVLIRVSGKESPLVAAEWYPVGVEETDKWTVVQTARSDTFEFRLGGMGKTEQVASVWLIYADFMGAKPPKNWPQELEYAGGILGYFEVAWSPGSSGGQGVCVRQRVPPRGTGFDWERWAAQTRGAADTYSTARLRAD